MKMNKTYGVDGNSIFIKLKHGNEEEERKEEKKKYFRNRNQQNHKITVEKNKTK